MPSAAKSKAAAGISSTGISPLSRMRPRPTTICYLGKNL